MKNFVIGCAIVALVLVLGVCGGAGYLAYKGAKMAKQFEGEFEGSIHDLRATDETFPFSPPADSIMDEQRYVTFLAVRQSAKEPMDSFVENTKQLKKLDSDKEAGNLLTNLFSAFRSVGGTIGAIRELPLALSASLNEHQMGVKEYFWYSRNLTETVETASRQGDEQAQQLKRTFDRAFRDMSSSGTVISTDFDVFDDSQEVEEFVYREENLALILKHVSELEKQPNIMLYDLILLGKMQELKDRDR